MRLRAGLWKPSHLAAEKVRGTVVLSPGRTEPIEKYYEVIGNFLARGFVVLAHDWRGQGLSHRMLEDRLKGHARAVEEFLDDYARLLDAFEARAPKPWIMVGHSMGGALNLMTLENGEERLIAAIECGTIPLTTALEIARAKHDDESLGDMLEEAYKTGQLKGHQITDAKRLIEKRREKGPKTGGDRPKLPDSAHSLVKTYQREVARQHKLMLKADHAHQQLLLVVQGLKRLFADENFVTLLRAEGLDTLPKYLADRIETA